jgi:hypothetical protein
MRSDKMFGILHLGKVALLPLSIGLAGCSSSSEPGEGRSAGSTLANIVMFQSPSPPPPPPKREQTLDDVDCPTVSIPEGGAALRQQGGQDSQSLRNQISINDIARECLNVTADGGYTMKVGVQGRVLIGPSGSPGSYGAGLRIVIKRGSTVLANRVVRVSATIPAGEAGADFTHVEQGLVVAPGRGDVDVFVSLEPGGGAARTSRRR